MGNSSREKFRADFIEMLEQRRLLSVVKGNIDPEHLTVLGNELIFTGSEDGNRVLFTSGGTGKSTKPVSDQLANDPALNLLYAAEPPIYQTLNGVLYYSADDNNGAGLFRSDGTAKGTSKVFSTPNDIMTIRIAGNMIFFTDGTNAWSSDGTVKGTVQITGTKSDPSVSQITDLVVTGDDAYFLAQDANDSSTDELVKANGSVGGTKIVQSFSNPDGNEFDYLAPGNGAVAFDAPTSSGKEGLWVSNGSANGTELVLTYNFKRSSDSVFGPFPFDKQFWFIQSDTHTGQELWKSDGTQVGTVPVAHINDQSEDESGPPMLGAIGNTLFLLTTNLKDAAITDLWKTDGTADGTSLVKEFDTDGTDGTMFSTKNGIFFSVSDGIGFDVWRTDGTSKGTLEVQAVPNGDNSYGTEFTGLGNQIYFTDGTNLLSVSAAAPITIRGTVFGDANGDGVLDDAESGVGHAAVWLDMNGNGLYDAGEPGTHTKADGSFVLSNLSDTGAAIRIAAPASWSPKPAVPLVMQIKSGGVGSFAANQISGVVFADEDKTGQQGDQLPLPGVRVFLDTNNDGMLEHGEESTRTGVDGRYEFDDVAAGTYHVRQTDIGDTATTPLVQTVTLGSAEAVRVDFGDDAPLGDLHGYVLGYGGDFNGTGIGGAIVYLDLDGDGEQGPNEPAVTVGGSGHFSFLVPAGTYQVGVEVNGIEWVADNHPRPVKMPGGKSVYFEFQYDD